MWNHSRKAKGVDSLKQSKDVDSLKEGRKSVDSLKKGKQRCAFTEERKAKVWIH